LQGIVQDLGEKIGKKFTEYKPAIAGFLTELNDAIVNGTFWSTISKKLVEVLTSDDVKRAASEIYSFVKSSAGGVVDDVIPGGKYTVGGLAGLWALSKLPALGKVFTFLQGLGQSGSKVAAMGGAMSQRLMGPTLASKAAGIGQKAGVYGVAAGMGTYLGLKGAIMYNDSSWEELFSGFRNLFKSQNTILKEITAEQAKFDKTIQDERVKNNRNKLNDWMNDVYRNAQENTRLLEEKEKNLADPWHNLDMDMYRDQDKLKREVLNAMIGDGSSSFTASLFDNVLPGITRDSKPKFLADAFKPVLSSLGRVGGAKGLMARTPLVDLQRRANELLEKIATNTAKQFKPDGTAVLG
jgi:hypothetical protein